MRFTTSDASHLHALHTFRRFIHLSRPSCPHNPMQAVTVDTDTAVLVRSLRSGELTLVQEPQVQGEGGSYDSMRC